MTRLANRALSRPWVTSTVIWPGAIPQSCGRLGAGTAHGSPLPTAEDAPARAAKAAAPKRRSAKAGGTLKAKYPGRCRCGTSYAAGTTIAKNGTGWGHVECAQA